MQLNVIGSSSHGNAYILRAGEQTLLIECGVKFIEIQKALDFDLSGVVGCIVSHSHQDHCKGMKEVIKSGIDVYASRGTYESLNMPLSHRTIVVQAGQQFDVGDFIVLPFPTQHDAPESLGFLIQYRPTGEKLLFATDTFYLRNRFRGLNFIMLECNYCKDTLDANIEAGYIPMSMRNRLLESHFSLENVKEFLRANDLSQVRRIVLMHLSDANSDAGRMVQEITELVGIVPDIAEPGKRFALDLYPY